MEYKIKRMFLNKKCKYIYIINNTIVKYNTFIKKLNDSIKLYNKVNNIHLLELKEVLKDIKTNGKQYTFKMELEG